MLSHLSCLVKSLAPSTKIANLNLLSKILISCHRPSIEFYSKSSNEAPNLNVVDVNIDKIMYEDEEFASNYNYEPETQITKSTDLKDVGIAPIDVDAWADEELDKAGTVDMEYIDKYKEEIHYSEPPRKRTGYYEFEGIKIWLPQRMLTPATYRYRMDEDEEQTLPDDIRICKFENFKPTS